MRLLETAQPFNVITHDSRMHRQYKIRPGFDLLSQGYGEAELFITHAQSKEHLNLESDTNVAKRWTIIPWICLVLITLGALFIWICRTIILVPASTPSAKLSWSVPAPLDGDNISIEAEKANSTTRHVPLNTSIDALVYTNVSSIEYILQNPCGHNATQARTLGCHFDMLEMAWLPSECYDPELEEELRAIKEWKFYHSMSLIDALTWDEAKTGEYDYLLSNWECKLCSL